MDTELLNEKKTKILAYIRSKEYIPLKMKELFAVLDVPADREEDFLAVISSLEEEGKIFITKKGRIFATEEDNKHLTGILSCNRRGFFGFVRPDDGSTEDIYVSGDHMLNALHGDRVIVCIDGYDPNRSRSEGHIEKILHRANETVTGIIIKEKEGILRLRPDDPRIYAQVRIPSDQSLGAQIGERAAAEITEYKDNGKVFGRLLTVMGDGASLKSCIDAIIFSNGIKTEFDAETIEDADRVPLSVDPADMRGRLDLRGEMVFTIDGDDARDFDDAVSVSVLPDGIYRLGVHIADVTHYVREGSALDSEAYRRATSVYLPDRVIPMLPVKLSNGICSLNPGTDRLTLSVIMDINSSGEVVSHTIRESVIRSKERMTYNNVNEILSGNETLRNKYSHILSDLETMEELAAILREKRDRRGAIQFDFPETKIVTDENGSPTDIVKNVRGASERIIEEFMLAANETVAEYAFWSELPFVYRIHEAPSADKISSFNAFIQNFGLKIKGRVGGDAGVHPKELQRILEAVQGTPNERPIASTMLRSLMKAAYSPENKGHFGLAAKYYCHFTSPIRRYPDLAVHRILKEFISGNMSEKRVSALKSFTALAAAQSSDMEVSAEHAEREADDLMIAAYMSRHVGEEFEGVISSVASFGIFVELENGAEGLIRFENMTDDFYIYSESSASITGEKTRKVYQIGDTVNIVVASCDLQTRSIDFVLAKDSSLKLLKRVIKHSSKNRTGDIAKKNKDKKKKKKDKSKDKDKDKDKNKK